MKNNTQNFNPFNFFREMYAQAEENGTKAWETFSTTEDVTKIMGNYMDSYMKNFGAVENNIDQFLKAAKIPTQDDVIRLANLILSVENKIDQLEERMDKISSLLENSIAKEQQ